MNKRQTIQHHWTRDLSFLHRVTPPQYQFINTPSTTLGGTDLLGARRSILPLNTALHTGTPPPQPIASRTPLASHLLPLPLPTGLPPLPNRQLGVLADVKTTLPQVLLLWGAVAAAYRPRWRAAPSYTMVLPTRSFHWQPASNEIKGEMVG